MSTNYLRGARVSHSDQNQRWTKKTWYPPTCRHYIWFSLLLMCKQGGHGSQDQICFLKMLECIDFCGYDGSWLLRSPVIYVSPVIDYDENNNTQQ